MQRPMIPSDVSLHEIVVGISVSGELLVQFTMFDLELLAASGGTGRHFDPMVQHIGELLAKVAG